MAVAPESRASGPAASGGMRPALGVQQVPLFLAQRLDGSGRFQQRQAGRGTPHGAGQRQGVPRAGAGAQHRGPAVEGAQDRDADGQFAAPAQVAAGHGTVRGAQFPDRGREPVGEVLDPGDTGFRGHREADDEGRGAGTHGIDVAEVLRGGLPADVVAGGPVTVVPLKPEVLVHHLGVDAEDCPAVRRRHDGGVVARPKD